MFGYIQTYRDELKYREYALYRHHYCELCRNMGGYSTVSRWFLSYDITFFLMLGDPETPECCSCSRCSALKCAPRRTEGIYDFFAALSIALIYHKLNNDVLDKDRLKAVPRAMIRRAYKAVEKKFPEVAHAFEHGLGDLVFEEQKRNTNYAMMAKMFSDTVTEACSPFFSRFSDGKVRLEVIGCVSECVYLMDIVDDIDKDLRHNDYNPLNILANGKPEMHEIELCISLIRQKLSHACDLSSLLPFSDCTPVIQNILTLGIPRKLEQIREKYCRS